MWLIERQKATGNLLLSFPLFFNTMQSQINEALFHNNAISICLGWVHITVNYLPETTLPCSLNKRMKRIDSFPYSLFFWFFASKTLVVCWMNDTVNYGSAISQQFVVRRDWTNKQQCSLIPFFFFFFFSEHFALYLSQLSHLMLLLSQTS